MRLTDGKHLLEIQPGAFPSGFVGSRIIPDVLLSVRVQVDGYSAHDHQLVEAADWCAFVRDFSVFDQTRRGEVTLHGEDPTTFTLRFYVYDRAGHTAVEGHLAQLAHQGQDRAQFTFAMPFESDQLSQALADFRTYRQCVD